MAASNESREAMPEGRRAGWLRDRRAALGRGVIAAMVITASGVIAAGLPPQTSIRAGITLVTLVKPAAMGDLSPQPPDIPLPIAGEKPPPPKAPPPPPPPEAASPPPPEAAPPAPEAVPPAPGAAPRAPGEAGPPEPVEQPAPAPPPPEASPPPPAPRPPRHGYVKLSP